MRFGGSKVGVVLALLLASGCIHRPLDAELTHYDYPFPVRHFAFESQRQQLQMAYMDLVPGERPNGRTVVLFHGKNFSGAYWAPTAKALLEQGFRVVIPDQIGFGKSSKPERYQFTFQQLAVNTAQLLHSLGIQKAAVVGHSMGGMLATRFALMYPENTTRLVLVNPIGLEDWKTAVPYRTVDEHYQAELRQTREGLREYMKNSYFGGQWRPEYEPLLDIPAGWTESPDLPKVAWDAALTSDMIFTQPVVYEFPLVRVPTLLVIGQRDRTAIGKAWAPPELTSRLGDYPRLGREAAHAIPNARLVEIQNAGHLPQVEAFPYYSAALLDFLAAP